MRLTAERRQQLIDAVMEFQASWKSHRTIVTFLVEEHGCTQAQARALIDDANRAWAQVAADDPGKGRHIEALGRIARKAEETLQLGVAVKALAELAKVQGLHGDAETAPVEDVQEQRLAELLAKVKGEGA